MNLEKIWHVLLMVAGCLALGWIGSQVGTYIVPDENWEEAFWSRFQYMFIFAVLIERSVEVYLNTSSQNGPDRFTPKAVHTGKGAARIANTAAITLGILLALAGVRLLSTLGAPTSQDSLANIIWFGSDIILSAGLMAGGAVLFHEVAEVLRGGIGSLGGRFSPVGEGSAPVDIGLSSSYAIRVIRTGRDTGRLEFASGSVSLNETCYWDPGVKISASTYINCSKTRMSSKKDTVTGEPRHAIYLPDAVVPGTDNHSVFIHEGKDPSWSDGCIVLDRTKMLEMWHEINPKERQNVIVTVVDV